MRYFIPEWDDKVDPGYDFINDQASEGHRKRIPNYDHYMWDIFGEEKVPFDGLLVSIATIRQNKQKFSEILRVGVHEYFKISKKIEVIADCGAFSYITSKEPAYTTEEAFDLYAKGGFDYGVTVDHLVVPAFHEDKDYRMEITRKNGLDGLKLWKEKYSDRFQLILAVQGETVSDYISMYHAFLKEGATHIAFGGLVRTTTEFIQRLILAIIQDIMETGKKPKLIHFFGVARLGLLEYYKDLEKLGVQVSFDSASYLRKAWLSSPSAETNYLSAGILDSYSAIRIPKTVIPKDGMRPHIEEQQRLERLALEKLHEFDAGNTSLDEVLNVLWKFNKFHNYNDEILDFYKRTLSEKPWKKCQCPLCRELGIDIVIFRGNDRNRRRGFHNVYTFYNVLKSGKTDFPISQERQYQALRLRSPANVISDLSSFQKEENVLLVVGCSKKKENTQLPVPARVLYLGNVFKLCLAYADLMGYPVKIISAKYGLIDPTVEIPTYDQVLRTVSDSDALRPMVEPRIRKLLPKYDKILVIAGTNYRRTLINIEDDRFYYLKVSGIGMLQKTLKDTINNIVQTQLEDYIDK